MRVLCVLRQSVLALSRNEWHLFLMRLTPENSAVLLEFVNQGHPGIMQTTVHIRMVAGRYIQLGANDTGYMHLLAVDDANTAMLARLTLDLEAVQ